MTIMIYLYYVIWWQEANYVGLRLIHIVLLLFLYMFLIGHLSHVLPVKIYMTRVDTSSMYRLTSLRNRGRKR